MTPELAAEWRRTFWDIRPSAALHTVERRKPAVHAAWRARALNDDAANALAHQWQSAGWSPAEWWRLAASVQLSEALAGRASSVRELTVPLVPEDWATWRELAAEHGDLTATLALRDARDMPFDSKLFWAGAERKLTRPGIGRPGEPISE